MASEFMLVQMITIVLSSPQPGVLYCQCLDSGKTKTSLSGSPQKSEHLMLVSVFSFFPLRSQIMRFFFFPSCATLSWEVSVLQVSVVNLLLASVQLVLCSPGVQKSLNWFLNFLQRELVPDYCLSWCLYGEKRTWSFLVCHIADTTLHKFILFIVAQYLAV